MQSEINLETFYPGSRQEWRDWLETNHGKKQSVWLIFYKKASGHPTIHWREAVDEALCFGWIDSKSKPIDGEKFMQFFSRRKPNSTWSKINKEKVRELKVQGLMSQSGLDAIKIARQNGSWQILDSVEALRLPVDLKTAMGTEPAAQVYFKSLSKSIKKQLLMWLVLAKKSETRQARISEIVCCCSRKVLPKPFGG